MSKILIAEINAYNSEAILNKIQAEIKFGWDKGLLNTGERWLIAEDDFEKMQESLYNYEAMESEVEDLEKQVTKLEDENEKLEIEKDDFESSLEGEQENHGCTLLKLKELEEEFEKVKQENEALKRMNTILKNEVKVGKLKSAN